jgi:accessory gene regulator B
MIEQLAVYFSNWLVGHGANEEDAEVYVYAIECFLGSAITFSSLLLVAILLDRFATMVIWLLFWLPLRSFLGGFHASTQGKCYWGSLAVGVLNILLYPLVPFLLIPAIAGLSLLTVFQLAPVSHPNHPLSTARHSKMQKMARWFIVIEIILVFLLYSIQPDYSKIAALAILTASLLAILGKTKP